MKVASVSGDLIVKLAVAVAAVAAVWYVARKTSEKISGTIEDIKNAPSSIIDASQQWYEETIAPAYERPNEETSPVLATVWDVNETLGKFGPMAIINPLNWPEMSAKVWGLFGARAPWDDSYDPNYTGTGGRF